MSIISKLFKKTPSETRPSCAAVVVAGGSSTRFGGNKLFVKLYDRPVLAHTLLAFQECAAVDEIIVVARSEDIIPVSELCKSWGVIKVKSVVAGGARRMDSSLAGVSEVSRDIDFIAIHDGARPLVTSALIESAICAAYDKKAVIAAVPIKDTVKVCENGMVASTPERSRLVAAQTPQVFDAALIKGALVEAVKNGAELTDDCAAVEAFGAKVWITDGSDENLKITTPADLAAAEALYERRLFQCE